MQQRRFMDEFIPLSVQKFSKDALETDVQRDAESLNFPLLGLFGKVGSLLSEVKKKQRDPTAYRAYAAAVTEELGDVLWYFNLVASRGGISLAEVVTNLVRGDGDWKPASGENITFEALQPAVLRTLKTPSKKFEKGSISIDYACQPVIEHTMNKIMGCGTWIIKLFWCGSTRPTTFHRNNGLKPDGSLPGFRRWKA